MKRRTFLWSSAALISAVGLVGCVGTGEPYDASNAEVLYPPIGKFVTVDGLKLHYWEAGEGPPLILIHGASGNVRDWTFSIAPELAKEFRVIAFDRPGFGFSDRPAEDGWDPGVQARAIQAGAQAIGAENPIVIGHSWGGAVAMSWALQFPEQTRGVIPISAVTMPYGGMSRVFRAIGLDGVLVDAYVNYVRRTAADGGIERFVARAFRPQQPPPGYLAYVGAPLSLREPTIRANSEDIQNLNVALQRMAPEYPSIEMPVEIIVGSEDFINPRNHSYPMAEEIPTSRLTVLPGIGHMAHHAGIAEIRSAAQRILA